MTWSFEVPILGILMRPWRLLVIIYALPSLVFTTILLFLPESPKFSWNIGKHDVALDVLRRMYSANNNTAAALYPVSREILLVL